MIDKAICFLAGMYAGGILWTFVAALMIRRYSKDREE